MSEDRNSLVEKIKAWAKEPATDADVICSAAACFVAIMVFLAVYLVLT